MSEHSSKRGRNPVSRDLSFRMDQIMFFPDSTDQNHVSCVEKQKRRGCMERLIFHVDVNSAYLSWEAARRVANGEEDIRLIPSAVGGDRGKTYWRDSGEIDSCQKVPGSHRRAGCHSVTQVSSALPCQTGFPPVRAKFQGFYGRLPQVRAGG